MLVKLFISARLPSNRSTVRCSAIVCNTQKKHFCFFYFEKQKKNDFVTKCILTYLCENSDPFEMPLQDLFLIIIKQMYRLSLHFKGRHLFN